MIGLLQIKYTVSLKLRISLSHICRFLVINKVEHPRLGLPIYFSKNANQILLNACEQGNNWLTTL